ncbi:hypothetical protein MIMGU_mgv11b013924mg [Erythranthe guttata]|uniref:Uncharacterized protein n=1 Tax=Erythranthe guttata TaxID=4155 RepID=A0A022R7K9_ERYGU|nr:hypothetical protein MIMGU_mgv11b013924mg [Erythranthe guttata]
MNESHLKKLEFIIDINNQLQKLIKHTEFSNRKKFRTNQVATMKIITKLNFKNLMSVLGGNDVGIDVDVGPVEKLAKGQELVVVGLGDFTVLPPELRRRLGGYGGGYSEDSVTI